MAYENPKGDGWYGDFQANGKRKRKLFSIKAMALLWEAQMLDKKEKGELGIDIVRKMRFNEFSKIYLEEYSKPAKSEQSYNTDVHYMKSLDSFFGGMWLGDISESDVNRYKVKRKIGHKEGTVNRCMALLSVVFTKALKHRIDGERIFKGENPVSFVTFYDEIERTRYLTVEEIDRLYAACSGSLLALVKLAVNTGMRKGEIHNLVWSDINMDAQVIRIRESKSGRSRVVPMTLGAREAILSLARSGEKLFPESHRRSFETALDDAKIVGCRFHDLRHTFASHFIMQGGSQSSLMEILGHSSRKMTDRYITLSSDYKTREISRLDTLWTPEQKEARMALPQLARIQ